MPSHRHAAIGLLICVLAASRSYGDGCFVWKRGADLNEPSQKAVIYFDDRTEVMILQVKYEGPAKDFAWIVPLPTRPKLDAIEPDKSPFAEISLYTQQRVRWGRRGLMDKGQEGKQAVTVLERKVVGIYDIAVLAAADPAALGQWLNKNGYAFPEGRNDVLEHYTRKRWVYMAMRIDRKALHSGEVEKLKVGELQPIRFTFASDEMVYPLRISSINAGQTEVLLYLLADAPMVLKAKRRPIGLSIEQNISYFMQRWSMDPDYGTFRKVGPKELPLTWEALGVAKEAKLSLCKYRTVYKTAQMSDDLAFEAFEPLPYWENRLKTETNWQIKLAISDLLIHLDKDKHRETLQALLEQWSKSSKIHLRRQAARHPNASAGTYKRLAGDWDREVRWELAENPRIPSEVLRELAEDEDADVRLRLAGNPAIGDKLLWRLAKDANGGVIRAVVNNPRVPIDVLRELAGEDSADRRAWVAACPRSPVDLLQKLARDSETWVRACTAANPNTPPPTLALLARSDREYVRKYVASNPNAPAEILAKLGGDAVATVREQVASNPKTPGEVLAALARDPEAAVRQHVADNPAVPTAVLIRFASGNDQWVTDRARRYLTRRGVAEPKLPKIGEIEMPDGLLPEVKVKIGLLFSASPLQRGSAARDLGRMKTRDAAAIPLLVALLDDHAALVFTNQTQSTTVSREARAAVVALAPFVETDDPAMNSLFALLASWDHRVRETAIRALGWMDEPRGEEPLLKAMDDPSLDVRRSAIEALGRRRLARAVGPLIAALDDRRMRSVAAGALAQIGKPAVQPVVTRLRSDDPAVRRRASEVLREMKDATTVQPLLKALDDKDLDVRTNAARALGKIGDRRAIAPLVALLKREDVYFEAACSALSDIGEPAVTPLLDVFQVDSYGIRDRAANSLAKMGKPAIKPLITACNHEDWRVREGSVSALAKMQDDDPRLLVTLIKTVDQDESDRVRQHVVGLLSKRPGRPAFDAMIRALGDEDVDVRDAAAIGLRYRQESTEALGPLIGALDDEHSSVRSNTAQSLKHITGEDFGTDQAKWQHWWKQHKGELRSRE